MCALLCNTTALDRAAKAVVIIEALKGSAAVLSLSVRWWLCGGEKHSNFSRERQRRRKRAQATLSLPKNFIEMNFRE